MRHTKENRAFVVLHSLRKTETRLKPFVLTTPEWNFEIEVNMTDSLENKGRSVVPKVPQSGNKQSNPRTLTREARLHTLLKRTNRYVTVFDSPIQKRDQLATERKLCQWFLYLRQIIPFHTLNWTLFASDSSNSVLLQTVLLGYCSIFSSNIQLSRQHRNDYNVKYMKDFVGD